MVRFKHDSMMGDSKKVPRSYRALCLGMPSALDRATAFLYTVEEITNKGEQGACIALLVLGEANPAVFEAKIGKLYLWMRMIVGS